nr:hypothetical protein [Tanacetum cinerariifolium]
VRSGDFVRNLLREARNRNEYAFALGALAHYAADNEGHPEATNLVLPNTYPEKKAQFGPVVTYEQAPINHTEVEFSFDVVQIAAGRYRSQEYHKYIGFRVEKILLERAFRQTYGLELGQVFFNVDASIVQPTDTAALAPKLPNTNLDTGKPTHPTDYILADVTYDDLLLELHKHNFGYLTPSLQQNILAYFAAGPQPSARPARYTKATE